MDEKAWQLLMKRLDSIDEEVREIKQLNREQSKILSSLGAKVTSVTVTVALMTTWVKSKFFGG